MNPSHGVKIGPNVEGFSARTPTLPPATHTNSYALGGRDVLLVEPATPYPDEQRKWLDWARSLGSTGRRLVGLFLTHHHVDHCGGTEVFARELGVPVWAHRMTADRLPGFPITRRLADGEDVVLDAPVAQKWRVLLTPGHAPGHLCLHEASLGMLVVGDMVASEGTIIVEPNDGDMRVYIEQLDRLRSLGSRLALPAHGDPIQDPRALFTHYIEHRLLREQKVLVALRSAGPSGATAGDLVPDVYADTPRARWGLAEMSLSAHLIKLAEDGLASRNDQRYFAQVP